MVALWFVGPQPGESLLALNGQQLALDAQVGVVADARGPDIAGRHHGRGGLRGVKHHAPCLC